ncbi:MAG TPA: glycosyltransferase family 2 protein [Sandaracinaceae bacterium]
MLSVLVATFDEEDTIEACVRRIAAVPFELGLEILVVDGGRDRTGAIVRALEAELPVRYVRNEGDRGKGHAIRTGCAAARGDVIAQIDADLQFLPEELPRLVAPIREGRADVVLGSRFARGSVRGPGSTPLVRTLGNKLASGYASLLFGHRMTDVQAGMKAWSRRAMERFGPLTSDGYAYEVEIPARALRAGLRVIDVPVTTEARAGGETKVNVVLDGLPLLVAITRFRLGR